MDAGSGRIQTRPSIFLRLNRTDTRAREIAWREFHARYAPVIAGFARRLGARIDDLDDVIQEVLFGFFAKSPTFVYDPAQGRFRGYLKTCTCRVLWKRAERNRDRNALSIDLAHVHPDAVETEQVWNDVWEQQLLRRAIEQVRAQLGLSKTFRAFELYVMLDRPPKEVSQELGLHIDNVYRSKEQITQLLRDRIDALRAED
jgi:RNA polymerase sigma factor (sigma-70 family)